MLELISFLKDKLLEEYKDHIDLIIVYGSYARGTFNEFSDIDIFAIVDAETRYSGVTSLPWNFRYKNIGIDCWESIWSQQEENLDFIKKNYFLYPIAGKLDCRILYYRDEKTLQRFKNLQDKIKQVISDNEANIKIVSEQFKLADSFVDIFKAQREGDILTARMSIWHAIFHMITALARINNTYYTKNWGKNLYESYKLKLLPKDFESKINYLIQTEDLSEALNIILDLDLEIKSMIKKQEFIILKPKTDELKIDEEHMSIVEYLNKMRSSCKRNDLQSLSYEASELQLMVAELIAFLEGTIKKREQYAPFSITGKDYFKQKLPDFTPLIRKGDFTQIVQAIEIFQENIDLYLKDKSSIKNISDFETLKEIIESKINSLKIS